MRGVGAQQGLICFLPISTRKKHRSSVWVRVKSSGLGLSIVTNVLEAHGGRLEIENAAAGGTMISAVLLIRDPGPRSTMIRRISTP